MRFAGCENLFRWFVVTIVLICLGCGDTRAVAQVEITYAGWRESCLATPSNRTLQGRMPSKEQLPLPDFSVMTGHATKLLEYFQKSDLVDDTWVGEKPKSDEFFDIQRSYYTRPPIPFQPFLQKVDVEPGSKLIFHGDFHGDIRSLITSLDWLNEQGHLDGFRIKDANTYLVFLGDYVDRGSYGVEVLYTLMRLKLDNPDRVLMARGNHEDFKMTANYGFLREGQLKYGKKFNPLPLWRVYDFLPVAIYVGVGGNYIQCNHGGMESGYDPSGLLRSEGRVRYELLGEIKQKAFAAKHPAWLKDASVATKRMAAQKLADFTPLSPAEPNTIGFMWNDFSVFTEDPTLDFNPGRLAFIHGQASTKYLMEQASSDQTQLRAVFRAHQHSSVPNPMMRRLLTSKGAFRHWQAGDSPSKEPTALRPIVDTSPQRPIPDGSVWTFNVAPDSVYGAGNNYTFDTLGVLETAAEFEEWRLTVVNVAVPTK